MIGGGLAAPRAVRAGLPAAGLPAAGLPAAGLPAADWPRGEVGSLRARFAALWWIATPMELMPQTNRN